MILTHYDDGKQKWQSHEIRIKEDINFYNREYDIYNHEFLDITGYGETKEEAFEDFKRKFNYVLNEWISFSKMLFETNVIEDNIVKVDCFGDEV